MDTIKSLYVKYQDKLVGTLALYKNQFAAFEYDKDWLNDGFSISPYSLPLENKVFIPRPEPFEGMYGAFADSLPDGWGRLLVDRQLIKHKILPQEINSIERLAIVGISGMGALTYEPDRKLEEDTNAFPDLDKIAADCASVLKTETSGSLDNLDQLFKLGGSSGGARPKILTQINGEDWIIKFPSFMDSKNVGEQEYRYSICAKECGISMEETRLFPSEVCSGYFGTRRFDRVKSNSGKTGRIHMLSVSALLETSHRLPNLDYHILMKLTLDLTKDFAEVEKMYRLMCFNVYAHNRDDHSKNFTFLYKDEEKRWLLSPAYDLTYSSSLNGEHATCIDGNGSNPGLRELLAVATNIGMKERRAKSIAADIQEIVKNHKLIEIIR